MNAHENTQTLEFPITRYVSTKLEERIASLTAVPSSETQNAFRAEIDAEAALAKPVEENAVHTRFTTARSSTRESQERLDSCTNACEKESSRKICVSEIALFRAPLAFVAFIICCAADLEITRKAMAWLMDIGFDSVIAYGIAGLILAILAGLEFPLWMRLRPYLVAPNDETSTNVWARRFATAIFVLGIATAACLAIARIEIEHSLSGDNGEIRAMNPILVNPAIVAIAIAATVNGALLSLIFMTDANALLARHKHERRKGLLETERLKAVAYTAQCTAAEQGAERADAQKEVYGELAAEEFRARMNAALLQKIDSLRREQRQREDEADRQRHNEEKRQRDEEARREQVQPSLDDLIHDTLRYEMHRRTRALRAGSIN